MRDPVQCKEWEALLVLYAGDELDPARRAAVEDHVARCAACAAALAAGQRLLEAVAARPGKEPSPALLAQCRSELAEALDELGGAPSAWRRWTGWLAPARWFALRPALSAAALVLAGVLAGLTLPELLVSPPAVAGDAAETVTGLAERDLGDFDVRGVSLLPAGSGSVVSVRGTRERPLEVRGPVTDSDVRGLLMSVVLNSQRFETGVRLESIEALRTQGGDAEVRRVLCHAARYDRNPGVRLKALEALREFGAEAEVRQTLLEALLEDDNHGVRVEAISALRALVEAGLSADPQLVGVLRDRMERDPSTYVRMQSAAALRWLGLSEQP